MSTPALSSLASKARWSVSGRTPDGKDKMPLDIFRLKTSCAVTGCNQTLEGATTTLHDLERTFTLPNAAFYLVSAYDDVCLLDIEPTASQETIEYLLSLEDIIYAEWSLSGRGIHVVLPVTPALVASPFFSKVVWRHPSGTYELHLQHWVTFTGNRIDLAAYGITSQHPLDEFYASLAAKQQASSLLSATVDIPELDKRRVTAWHWWLVYSFHTLLATHLEQVDMAASGDEARRNDYNDDHSLYEYCLFRDVIRSAREIAIPDYAVDNSTDALAYALYDAVAYDKDDAVPYDDIKEADIGEAHPLGVVYNPDEPVLDDREKFHTLRRGLPYLLWTISRTANKFDRPPEMTSMKPTDAEQQAIVESITGALDGDPNLAQSIFDDEALQARLIDAVKHEFPDTPRGLLVSCLAQVARDAEQNL